VDELVIVQPSEARGSKNDALDAWARAEEIRVGSFTRPVFKAPGKFRALREAVRMHDSIVRDRIRVKQRLRALYSARGLQRAGAAIYDPGERARWQARLPPAYRRRARILSKELDRLSDVCDEAERWLIEQARRTPDVRLLMTAPGLAEVRASEIVAHVVTPHRFRTKRQFWSYCGLGIVTRSSSDWRRDGRGHWEPRTVRQTRGLNRQCSRPLKNVFKGAVQTIITMPDEPLSLAYRELVAAGKKPNLAKLTIARRLSAIILAMWKRKEEYDRDRYTGNTAAMS
jgi:transposase